MSIALLYPFFQKEPETILNLLCLRENVKALWREIQEWCKPSLSRSEVPPQMGILGCIEDREHNIFQNFIAIRFKKFFFEKTASLSEVALPHFSNYSDLMNILEYKAAA